MGTSSSRKKNKKVPKQSQYDIEIAIVLPSVKIEGSLIRHLNNLKKVINDHHKSWGL